MRRITAVAVLLIAAAACPVCTLFRQDAPCCLSVSKRAIHLRNIESYYVQEAVLCPVRAVVFRTRRGKHVCADPDQERVRLAMRRVDEERKNAGAMTGGY